MLAEPSAQGNLLRLADLDAELARVTHAAKSLPQHATIQTLMQQRQEIGDALTASTTAADDLGVAVRRAEQDLVPVKARLERNQQRVNDGSVTDSKQLQSMLAEIEHLKGRISDLEDAQLEVMGQLEEATSTREQLAARRVEIEQQLREEVKARDEQVVGLKEEAQSIVASRATIAKLIPEPLLKLYDRLRASSGIGAAQIVGGRCGGCRLQLTITDMDRFKKAPANEVCRCPECERILVRTETN